MKKLGVPDIGHSEIIAAEAPGERTSNKWCEAVSDEEYAETGAEF